MSIESNSSPPTRPVPVKQDTEYFDAPMHFFSSSKSDKDSDKDAKDKSPKRTLSRKAPPAAAASPDPEKPLANGAADVNRQPTVTMARKQPTEDSNDPLSPTDEAPPSEEDDRPTDVAPEPQPQRAFSPKQLRDDGVVPHDYASSPQRTDSPQQTHEPHHHQPHHHQQAYEPPQRFVEAPDSASQRSMSPLPVEGPEPVYAPKSPSVNVHADAPRRRNSLKKRTSSRRAGAGVPMPASASARSMRSQHDRDYDNASTRGSVVTARSSMRRRNVGGTGTADGGGAFIHGAATTGPNAAPELDGAVRARGAHADGALTPKQRSRIEKDEKKDGKRLSKVILAESKQEKLAFNIAIKELTELQKIQKAAVKREAKSHTAYSSAHTRTLKAETALMAAQTAHARAEAESDVLRDALERTREAAREASEAMAEKMREIERLRVMKGVDERERGVKMRELGRV